MKLLANYGTEFVFGIPGVHTIELYRGIAESGIRHITPRHEQSAGFMADGYARATGKIGVCCLITGPGVTNAATAIAQAYSDSVPMLVISSVNKTSSLELGQGDLHELPGQALVSQHFTAFSHTILSTASIPAVIARAFSLFKASRPLPVHVEIPINLIDNPVDWEQEPVKLAKPPLAPLSTLKEAAKLLSSAQNPAVIAGGGCKEAAAEILDLIELLNAPIVTTFAGKGVISENHPLSCGASLSHAPILNFLKNSDVVLAIGTHLSETDIWTDDGDITFNGKLIRIDIDPNQLFQNATPNISIVGDARNAIAEMTGLMSSTKDRNQIDRIIQESLVKTLKAESQPYWYSNTQNHSSVWDIIRNELPDHGIVTADSTQLVYSGNYYYKALQPRTYMTSTTGFGTLGYALPAAIGAKLGRPDSPVVCVVGDGGFLFTIQELATAVEHKLPIAIVLWHNDGYGEIRDNFNRENVPLVGVDLKMPDFITVTQGFGCHAERVHDINKFPSMLRKAFQADRPTLLEISSNIEV